MLRMAILVDMDRQTLDLSSDKAEDPEVEEVAHHLAHLIMTEVAADPETLESLMAKYRH